MKLSVVIPVFRVENTLRRCVESVLMQSYTDLQVILVDDGSPDSCPILCDRLAASDARIQVVHQENRGLSDARNSGIQMADGEYITFIDSDDYLSPDTYKPLMDTLLRNPVIDMIEYPVVEHEGKGTETKLLTFTPEVFTDMHRYWLEAKAYTHTYAWNKIYRRKLFSTVRYPQGRVFEDVFTLPPILARCRTVAVTDQGLYHYTDNPMGITSQAKGNELRDLLEAHLPIINKVCNADYYAHVLNIQMDVYELTGDSPLLPLMPYRETLKLKLLHCLGIHRLCQLNKFIHKIYRHRS